MNRRTTALLLTAALAVGACGASVFAVDPPAAGPAPAQTIPVPDREEPPLLIMPAPTQSVQTGEQGEDAGYALAFQDVEALIREKNLNVLALDANIEAIHVVDYDRISDEIEASLKAIAKQQEALSSLALPPTGSPVQDAVNSTLAQMVTSSALQTLQSTYDSLDATFDELESGRMEDDNDAIVRQLRNAKDQIVKGGQALYIALAEMSITEASLGRSQAALERTVAEMELRYDMGQISALTLQEVKGGLTSLVSGRETLAMNLTNYKTQLELMVGADLTGAIRLQNLPRVTGEELAAMDLEADLKKAVAHSYDIFSVGQAMDKAEDAFDQAWDAYDSDDYRYLAAKQSRRAAEYTYDAAVLNFEMGFRTLYRQVQDYRQILSAAETALALEEASYAAAQLRHSQGTISQNALLTAADELESARDAVNSAAIDLFSAYNNYRWAVDHGILN